MMVCFNYLRAYICYFSITFFILWDRQLDIDNGGKGVPPCGTSLIVEANEIFKIVW